MGGLHTRPLLGTLCLSYEYEASAALVLRVSGATPEINDHHLKASLVVITTGSVSPWGIASFMSYGGLIRKLNKLN
jgi:hypothetical protein